jgi:hypothetical protein
LENISAVPDSFSFNGSRLTLYSGNKPIYGFAYSNERATPPTVYLPQSPAPGGKVIISDTTSLPGGTALPMHT